MTASWLTIRREGSDARRSVWQPCSKVRGWSRVWWLALVLGSTPAHADTVHLESGRVIEGVVTEAGDKVIIRIESGQVTLPRSEVARIERGVAPLDEVAVREAKLDANDRAGLLKLADYCRAHDLPAKERAILERLLALDTNDAEARRRLGFVRTDQGWVDRTTRAQQEAERNMERRKKELELEQKRTELRLAEARVAEERASARRAEAKPAPEPPPPSPPPVYSYFPYLTYPAAPVVTRPPHPHPHLTPPAPPLLQPPPPQPNYIINGVRDPASYIDDMQRRH